MQGKNAVNPDGFTSILTKPQRKILVSKSDSSLNALAKLQIVLLVFVKGEDLYCKDLLLK